MANSIVYDSTTQAQNGANSTITQGGFQAFSFSTGASGGSLADVQVELFELSQDSGSITAYLYSNTAGSNTLGSPLATLGSVSDASLNSGPGSSGLTLADFGGNTGTILAPNTRYWIKLVSTSNSNVNVEFASGSGGTGVSTEYPETQASAAGTSAPNATYGDSVQARVTEAVCFAAGTRLLTSRGEVPVERLAVGDLVVTSPDHPVEDGPQRWTRGCARLPAALWGDCRSDLFLRVELARPALPRWIAPERPKPMVPMSRRA